MQTLCKRIFNIKTYWLTLSRLLRHIFYLVFIISHDTIWSHFLSLIIHGGFEFASNAEYFYEFYNVTKINQTTVTCGSGGFISFIIISCVTVELLFILINKWTFWGFILMFYYLFVMILWFVFNKFEVYKLQKFHIINNISISNIYPYKNIN